MLFGWYMFRIDHARYFHPVEKPTTEYRLGYQLWSLQMASCRHCNYSKAAVFLCEPFIEFYSLRSGDDYWNDLIYLKLFVSKILWLLHRFVLGSNLGHAMVLLKTGRCGATFSILIWSSILGIYAYTVPKPIHSISIWTNPLRGVKHRCFVFCMETYTCVFIRKLMFCKLAVT